MATTRANQVVYFFPDTHLGNSHAGLSAIAEKDKLDVAKLAPGEFAMFINRSFTAVKLFAANNVIVHYKTPDRSMLNAQALKLVPHFFNGRDINYKAALSHAIRSKHAAAAKRAGQEA